MLTLALRCAQAVQAVLSTLSAQVKAAAAEVHGLKRKQFKKKPSMAIVVVALVLNLFTDLDLIT
jgi:hypothetical protein